MKKLNKAGFTIVELMIATMVFSIILLVCTFGLMEIGRNYYKGTNTIRTQNVARQIIDDISQGIQFGSTEPTFTGVAPNEVVASLPTGTTVQAFCVGNKRYSYSAARVQATTGHALVVDARQPTCGPQPFGVAAVQGRELLGQGMRLTRFQILKSGSDYTIIVKVTAGDDDLIDLSNPTSPTFGSCRGGRGSQFCAASQLQTTVHRRLSS